MKEYRIDGKTYVVRSDKQATADAIEQIRDSLWAFRAEFIAAFADLNAAQVKAVQKMQETLCEDANEIVYKMICPRFELFCSEAIRVDGRGHFLSSYDGQEVRSDDIAGLPKGKFAYRID